MTLSGQEYHCRAGETFDSVSLSVYGEERYACDLMGANPALCHVSVFTGGELLAVPVVQKPATIVGGRYVPVTAPWKQTTG